MNFAKLVKILFLKFKNILFHKSKYALTIWYSLLIWADKFHFRQIIIFFYELINSISDKLLSLYLLNTQKSFEIN